MYACAGLAFGLAVAGGLGGAPGRAADGSEFAGIWRIQVEAEASRRSFLCRAIPVLSESFLDTVTTAATLEEFVRAVIPDSLLPLYERCCTLEDLGDRIIIDCEMPFVLADPCSLTVRFHWTGSRAGPDSLGGAGRGRGSLHGPGLCPETGCPGVVTIGARRTTRSDR